MSWRGWYVGFVPLVLVAGGLCIGIALGRWMSQVVGGPPLYWSPLAITGGVAGWYASRAVLTRYFSTHLS